MTKRQAGRRVRLILLYEPSWFAEAMSAVGIVFWAAFAFLTDDYAIHGGAWVVPLFGLALGPLRVIALFALHALARVVCGMAGALWWAVLLWGMAETFGPIQGMGPAIALLIGDVLTVGKFSFEARLDTQEGDA